MSKKLRTGILGCAKIAERMVLPAIQQSDYLKAVVVASRSLEKARYYGEKFDCEYVEGYEALVERDDIDVVYMPLPTGLHLDWAIKCLENGKHLLIEKSLALNYNEAEQILNLAEEKKLLVQENFMFCYHRQFKFVKKIIEDGQLGALRCIRSSFGFPPFPDADNIRYQKELGGGALFDAGAYTIKIAQLLAGFDVEVKAGCLSYDKDRGVDIFGSLFLQNNRGVAIETSFGFDNYYQCELEVWGSKGKLTADRIFTAGPGITPTITVETAAGKQVYQIESDNHFLNLINDFGRSIVDESLKPKYGEVLNQARLMASAFQISDKFIVS